MKRRIFLGAALTLGSLFLGAPRAAAQHTLGVVAGYGMASARIDPKVESRAIWGRYSGGLTWRYYGSQRFVGGVGADLEFLQQGFSYAVNSSAVDDKSDYLYYTRRINTLMLPIVWQPHVYLVHNRLRVYLEAAATFSYQLSSSYENEWARERGAADWRGDYPFKLARDNRWGYGLAGGGGVAILIRRFELNFRVRYYFGFSDVVRNRTKYADNETSGSENPFRATPLRSPLDNLNMSVGLSYRFNKEGFRTWKPRPKREKNREVFKYGL
ncbi:MAG: PorT family protein [Alistipes sp.]|nr:PorT family protein [Alistipes sp.]